MFSFDGRELAAVFVGGALGTLARAAFETLAAPDPGRWPWPTFVVNILGAFLLGYFTTRLWSGCRCRAIGAHCWVPACAAA